MRYEHVLQIYWKKGFFFAGEVFQFNQTLNELMYILSGFGRFFKKSLVNRFELTFFLYTPGMDLESYQSKTGRSMTKPLNIIFSQIHTVNTNRFELYKLQIIRLYLIKSYKGRCHALGKPVRGQRTWSNAWNSYKVNKLLRSYISETATLMRSKLREEKINYKLVKKKYAVKSKKKKTKAIVKKPWF